MACRNPKHIHACMHTHTQPTHHVPDNYAHSVCVWEHRSSLTGRRVLPYSLAWQCFLKYLKLNGNWSTYSIDMFTAMCAHKIPIQSATVATEISNCNICRILPPTRHIFKILCRESPQLPLEKFFRVVDENLGLGRVVISHPLLLSQKCQFELTENVNDMCFFLFFFLVFPLFFVGREQCFVPALGLSTLALVNVAGRRLATLNKKTWFNPKVGVQGCSGLLVFWFWMGGEREGERACFFVVFGVLGFRVCQIVMRCLAGLEGVGGGGGEGALRHRGIRSRPTPDHPFSLILGFRFP